MKRLIHYFALPFILTLALAVLFSCNSEENYRDDVSCENLSKKICDEIDNFGKYSSYTKEEVALLLGEDSLFDDFSLIYSNDANDINEIGIFHCPDEKMAKEFFIVVKNYISDQQELQKSFIQSYAPREVPKLEAAEAKRYGNYVIYAILGEIEKGEAFEEMKELIKK